MLIFNIHLSILLVAKQKTKMDESNWLCCPLNKSRRYNCHIIQWYKDKINVSFFIDLKNKRLVELWKTFYQEFKPFHGRLKDTIDRHMDLYGELDSENIGILYTKIKDFSDRESNITNYDYSWSFRPCCTFEHIGDAIEIEPPILGTSNFYPALEKHVLNLYLFANINVASIVKMCLSYTY